MENYIKDTNFVVELLKPFIGERAIELQQEHNTIGLRNHLLKTAHTFVEAAYKLKLSKEEFVNYILKKVDDRPVQWRRGQAVFNYVDEEFGVSRVVQFTHKVDCFYNDSEINKFLDKAYEEYEKTLE